MTLRIAVFGLGAMGRLHAAKIPLIPGAELACVVDPDPAARAWDGVPAGVARHPSLDEPKGFEAAIIATPVATHHLLTSLLLARAVHCLVEKPVCPTAADAAKLVSQARYHPSSPRGTRADHPVLIEARRRAGRFMYIEASGSARSRPVDRRRCHPDLMIHVSTRSARSSRGAGRRPRGRNPRAHRQDRHRKRADRIRGRVARSRRAASAGEAPHVRVFRERLLLRRPRGEDGEGRHGGGEGPAGDRGAEAAPPTDPWRTRRRGCCSRINHTHAVLRSRRRLPTRSGAAIKQP